MCLLASPCSSVDTGLSPAVLDDFVIQDASRSHAVPKLLCGVLLMPSVYWGRNVMSTPMSPASTTSLRSAFCVSPQACWGETVAHNILRAAVCTSCAPEVNQVGNAVSENGASIRRWCDAVSSNGLLLRSALPHFLEPLTGAFKASVCSQHGVTQPLMQTRRTLSRRHGSEAECRIESSFV